MDKVRYSVLAVIDGQQIVDRDNTYEQFKRLVDLIYKVGGCVVEYTVEEVK
jgi:hypothetical protein